MLDKQTLLTSSLFSAERETMLCRKKVRCWTNATCPWQPTPPKATARSEIALILFNQWSNALILFNQFALSDYSIDPVWREEFEHTMSGNSTIYPPQPSSILAASLPIRCCRRCCVRLVYWRRRWPTLLWPTLWLLVNMRCNRKCIRWQGVLRCMHVVIWLEREIITVVKGNKHLCHCLLQQ